MTVQVTLKRGQITFGALVLVFVCGFGVGYYNAYTPPRLGETAEMYVQEVTDGDTMRVRCGNKLCTIRLMGVDTPETVDRRKPVQYCGPEAKSLTKKLEGQTLRFQFLPPEEPNVKRDKYDRLLAYVYTKDGKLFNEELIRQGMAREYKYRGTYLHRDRFLQAQDEAKSAHRGVWSDGACVKQQATQ